MDDVSREPKGFRGAADSVSRMSAFKDWRVARFVEPLYQHCISQFPLRCSGCGVDYMSFFEFTKLTERVGLQYTPLGSLEGDPVGLLFLSNCPCGSTLALGCHERGETYRMLLTAVEEDASTLGLAVGEVLDQLSEAVRDRGAGSPS